MTAFFKVSGAGNDFIVLADPDRAPDAGSIVGWCRRALSLGADGLFTLAPEGTSASELPPTVRMIHWNADGRRSELCLNGSRCAAQLAFELGWGGRDGRLRLVTDSGTLGCTRISRSRIRIQVPDALLGPASSVTLTVGDERFVGRTVAVGVPHLVLTQSTGLAQVEIDRLGPALRRHPDLGDAGANVNFVRWTSPRTFEIRTFERGVEAETLACGTGVLATARCAESPEEELSATTAGGFELTVGRQSDGTLTLEGDARLVARGELLPGALELPGPAAWT